MALSIFLIDYNDGQPNIFMEDVLVIDEQTNEYVGGWSSLEEITEPNQENVQMLLISSIERLTELKSDPRFEWVSDYDGWPMD